MKNVETSLKDHLSKEVTALCTCWQIERKDGVILRFTDADEDVIVDGDTFLSVGAYSRTAIESTETLSVDNLEVTGMATNLVLPVEELRAGLYDNATVKVFMTSWMPSYTGKVKLRRGFFGEVQVLPNGTFTVELRGLLQRLAHTYTEVLSATCRHDLGDTECKVELGDPFVTEGAHIPIPLQDADFEEAGSTSNGLSLTWYNPTAANDSLFTVSPTYSGTYAARGGATGGYLVQDVDLTQMGPDFLRNIDSGQVTLSMFGYRRDNGGSGRLAYQFLDYQERELRTPRYMNSASNRIIVPSISLAGDFTFETWIRFKSDFTTGVIFDWRDTNVNIQRTLSVTGDAYSRVFTLSFQNNESGVGDSEVLITSSEVERDKEVWHHIAVVRSGLTVILYWDGKEIGRGSSATSGGSMVFEYLGGNYINNDRFNADWDDIRIWNVARTREQINAFRYQDMPDLTTGLVRYYPFDDGTYGDAGSAGSGVLTFGGTGQSILLHDTPVSVSYRGTASGGGTGYENVGNAWTLRGTEDLPVPAHTRIVRIIFQHLFGSPNPAQTLLDSIYGYFKDPLNTVLMPDFEDTSTMWRRAGMVVSSGSARVFKAIINEPRAVAGWFDGGLVTFFSGANKGSSMEVKSYDATTNTIELFLSLPSNIKTGDLFTIYPGCDKSRICCSVFFDNIENFFGTPDVPGEDELFRYPDAS